MSATLLYPVHSDVGADGSDIAAMLQQIADLRAAVQALAGNDLAYPDHGSAKVHTTFDSDDEYADTIQNQGSGGHLDVPGEIQVKSDGTGTVIRSLGVTLDVTATRDVIAGRHVVAAQNVTAGAALSGATAAISGNGTVGGTLGVTGAQTNASSVQATRFISTVSAPTAPLQVASNVEVANLNAALLQGHPASDFLTPAQGDAAYVNVGGDTMTALLTMEPAVATDQILKLKGSSTSGGMFLGATNSPTPVLNIRDNGNALVAVIGNSGSVYQWDVSGGARISDELTVGGPISADELTVNTGGIHVDGSSDFDDGVSFGNGINVTSGTSLFGDTVTVSAGGIDVNGSSSFDDGVSFGNGINVTAGSSLFSDSVTMSDDFAHTGALFGAYSQGPVSRPTVTGSRGGNAALLSLITALENIGFVINSSSA